MLKKTQLKKIWEEVKANQKRLEECVGPHDFEEEKNDKPGIPDMICKKCNGRLKKTEAVWYLKGLKHGRL